jgi:uncharacterized protein YdeI (BOF family)
MTKSTRSLLTLGTLTLVLSAAPLFAQQPEQNSPTSPTAQTPSSSSPQSGQNQPGQTQSDKTQPGQPPAGQAPSDQASPSGSSQSFSGTVTKSGDKYVLQDASGKTYDVDRQEELKKYEGKQVRIQGTLDPDGKTIHVK